MAGVPVEKAGGNGAGFVNVGVNQSLGSNLSRQSGINLAGGQNVLKSQLTPLVSAKLSNQLSKTVEKTAGSVGSLNKALPSSSFLGGGGQMGGGGFGIGNILGGGGGSRGGGGGLGGGIGGFLSGLGGGGGSSDFANVGYSGGAGGPRGGGGGGGGAGSAGGGTGGAGGIGFVAVTVY
jgi:hypothetical protein